MSFLGCSSPREGILGHITRIVCGCDPGNVEGSGTFGLLLGPGPSIPLLPG